MEVVADCGNALSSVSIMSLLLPQRSLVSLESEYVFSCLFSPLERSHWSAGVCINLRLCRSPIVAVYPSLYMLTRAICCRWTEGD